MKTIYASQYAVVKNSEQDMTQPIMQMLMENPCNTTFVFEKGKYNFYAENALKKNYPISNTDYVNPRKIAILFQNMKNIVFDGGGSEFCLHGQSIPIAVDICSNITLKNLMIDWDIPLSAEGMISNSGRGYFDVKIDKLLYPHFVKEEKLFFRGESWIEPYGALTIFDSATKKVGYRLGDAISDVKQEQLENGDIRFYVSGERNPNIGDIAVLRHNKRLHPGVFLNQSKDISLDHITIHNTGGLGVLAQFCENITAETVRFAPNEDKGRKVVSGHDDGLHFSNCRGIITVSHCYFYGLMDDPFNLHGTCANVLRQTADNKLLCQFESEQSIGFAAWGKAGDEIALIQKDNMERESVHAIKSYKLLSDTDFELEFYETVALSNCNYAVENMSNTPELICTNNHFGSCRARGVLVSTPKPVLISNNLFESAGSAILLAGDANYWYESGGCEQVTIEYNEFADCCLTSEYQFCEAIISICPEIPKPDIQKPFHRNIIIRNNVFHPYDYPVLYALSANNLDFCGNKIAKSNGYEPWHRRKNMITLEYCSHVSVLNNQISGDVLGKDILLCGMETADIHTDLVLKHCGDCEEIR